MTIRLAAIGVGHWHALYDAAYLKAAARMPDIRLVGVQDPDLALCRERADALGDPPVFTDYRDMLARLKPDFVIVLGRHDAMAAAAHHLLDEGYPFLVEKPAGIDAEEVRGVAEKAAAKGAFAAVPLFQRYHPFVMHARRLIAEDAFGPLSHFQFLTHRGSSARYVSWGAPWMLDPAAAGGGCLRNVGTHGIDLFLHLLQEAAEVTGAQTSTRALGQAVEDYAAVLLRSASGVMASIEVGNTFPASGGDGAWRLSGRDGLLAMQNGAVTWTTVNGAQRLADPPPEPLATIALRDALARWKSGRPPASDLGDCYRAMQIIDRAYAIAAKTAAPVR